MRNKHSEIVALCAIGSVVAAGLAARAVIRMRRYISLENRTVLITGGSRGLGLCLARLAIDAGAKVVICARDEAELDRAREQLLARSPRVLAVQCDITVPAQLDELIRGTLGHFGSIDMLINNAGIIEVGPMQEMTLEDYRDAFNTHFCGPLHATLAALPVMRAQKGGRIVNITSIGGKVAAPHLLPYTASKFALVGFSEGLRAELARENVFVTTVAPGLFRSGSARHAVFKGRHRREYAWFSTASVLPLVSIDPDRLARRILRAAQHGQAELITPLAASVQARINGLMPGFTSEISALINRWLPSAGGIGNRRAEGVHSQSDDLTPEFVRQRNEEAARQHNEV